MKLRDYQQQLIRDVYSHFKAGKRRCLVFAPTGAGKTIVVSKLTMDALSKGRRILIVVHRTKLAQQLSESIELFCNTKPSLIFPGGKSDYSQPVQIAMAQTLNRRELPDNIDVLIGDEIHQTGYFDIWTQCLNKYCGSVWALNKKCFVVGLTATPWRTKSKEGFCHLFDCKAYAPSPRKLIESGYLTYPRLFSYKLLDTALLKVDSSEDYSLKSIAIACNEEYNKDVVEKWYNLCPEKKTIVFASTVKRATHLNEVFKSKGIKSEIITGSTSEKDRQGVFDRFKAGETQVLVSVSTLCLDEKTEILTLNGWKGIDEMSYSDLIANWSNGEIYYTLPHAIYKRQRGRNEHMVNFKSDVIDLRVTEGHSMVYQHKGSKVVNKVEAIELINKKVRLPISGIAQPVFHHVEQPTILSGIDYKRRISANSYNLRKREGYALEESKIEAKRRLDRILELRYREVAELTKDECKLIGFWLGDGSKTSLQSGGVEYVMASTSLDLGVIEQVDGVLANCGIDFIKREKHPSNCDNPMTTWHLSRGTGSGTQARSGVFHIEPFLSKTKLDWLYSLTVEQFEAFLFGYWLADGNHGKEGIQKPGWSYQIGCADYKAISLVQAVAVTKGYKAHLTTYYREKGNPLYTLNFKKQEFSTVGSGKLGQKPTLETEYKEERVWCVNVPSHNIIVRRNGKVAVVGNCEGYDETSIECVLIARPTRSQALLTQIVGRGLRLHQGKNEVFVIDCGECFNWLMSKKVDDPIDLHQFSLCPSFKKKGEVPTKECVSCGEEIPVFARICPHCGTLVPLKTKEKPSDPKFPQLEEILTTTTLKHYKWLRKEISKCFESKTNPENIFNDFHRKFGYLPPKDYFLGSIFDLRECEQAEAYYSKHLRQLGCNEPLVKFFLDLEFGEPGRKYQIKGLDGYTRQIKQPVGV